MSIFQAASVAGNGIQVRVESTPNQGNLNPDLLDDPSFGMIFRRTQDLDAIRRRLTPLRTAQAHTIRAFTHEAEGNWPRPRKAPLAKADLIKPPAWLRGTYRPRALTPVGYMALELLAPHGEGVRAYPLKPLASMGLHRDMLAARYVAMDMVQRGNAFEVNGSFYNIDMIEHRAALGVDSLLTLARSDHHIDEIELMTWLAIGKFMSMDQIITIDPENAYNNVALLLELRDAGIIISRQIAMGLGNIEVYHLSQRGWKWLQERYIDLDRRGFGPRKSLGPKREEIISSCSTGRYALHQIWQADAIMWFAHDIADHEGRVTDVYLDRSLMAEGGNLNGGRLLDFRMAYEFTDGRMGVFDVEVIGVGDQYRTTASKKHVISSPAHRSFSGAPGHIAFGRHVSIGR